MKRRSLIRALLSIALVIYMAVGISMANAAWREAPMTGIAIEVQDSTECNFVTSDSILQELGSLPKMVNKLYLNEVNTDSLERLLNAMPTLEGSQVVRRTDGLLYVNVVPMRPVARVFARDGTSYYVNRQGKRMPAQLRYRIDVPVVVDEGWEDFDPMYTLPVIDYIEQDSVLKHTVTAINVARNGDIFVVPSFTGMVINLGDTTVIANKFDRFDTLCRKVLPLKGWDTYDTISVKWRGQLVATHRNKSHGRTQLPAETFLDEEEEDIENMTTDIPPNPRTRTPNPINPRPPSPDNQTKSPSNR